MKRQSGQTLGIKKATNNQSENFRTIESKFTEVKNEAQRTKSRNSGLKN